MAVMAMEVVALEADVVEGAMEVTIVVVVDVSHLAIFLLTCGIA